MRCISMDTGLAVGRDDVTPPITTPCGVYTNTAPSGAVRPARSRHRTVKPGRPSRPLTQCRHPQTPSTTPLPADGAPGRRVVMNGLPGASLSEEGSGGEAQPGPEAPPPGPGAGQPCCLREEGGERCTRAAGNASFSKRIQKSLAQKRSKLQLHKSARHLYICDFHKNVIQSVRNRRKRKGSDDDEGDSPVHDVDTPEVDLFQLQVNTLRRYKRHFKLQARPGLNKAQLVEIIGCHFRMIPVNEKDTLTYFICSVKNDKNKPEQKPDGCIQ